MSPLRAHGGNMLLAEREGGGMAQRVASLRQPPSFAAP